MPVLQLTVLKWHCPFFQDSLLDGEISAMNSHARLKRQPSRSPSPLGDLEQVNKLCNLTRSSSGNRRNCSINMQNGTDYPFKHNLLRFCLVREVKSFLSYINPTYFGDAPDLLSRHHHLTQFVQTLLCHQLANFTLLVICS